MPSVSIISVTFHTGPVLFDMIAAALAQDDAELVLVNNGNPLDVFHRLQKMAEAEPRLRLISGHGNVGFASGCNIGVENAGGDYFLFLNPDCVLPPGMAACLARESKNLPRPHLVGARIVDENGKEQSGSRRDILTPWKAFVEVSRIYLLFPKHPYFRRFKWHELDVPDKTEPVPAISGALLFAPRGDYARAGGFDNGYFLHVEDLDLCFRMHKCGGKVYFMPDPPVLHLGATSKAPATLVEWHKTRSFVRYFFNNFSDTYPKFFLCLVSAAVWLRFFLRAAARPFS